MSDRASVVALVGDFDAKVLAHRAIGRCFDLASSQDLPVLQPRWSGTQTIDPGDRSRFRAVSGIWCVPASPYRHTAGALWAIRYAREERVPFLGTCGGFQHAILDYARNVLGLVDADHQETNPTARMPLVQRLQCSLVQKSQKVMVAPHSNFKRVYGSDWGQEQFHCSYGLNPDFESLFADTSMEVAARDAAGEVRAIQLRDHPFFVGTLFQPERRALQDELHPVVAAFFAACRRHRVSLVERP